MSAGQKRGTRERGVGMDRPSVGRDHAGQRVVRGSAQGRRGVVQPHQQNRTRVGEKDPDQGYQLPADGEHSTVWIFYPVIRPCYTCRDFPQPDEVYCVA